MLHPMNDEWRRTRFPLTCALVDLINWPSSQRYLRFVANLANTAGYRVTAAGKYSATRRPDWVDVLEVMHANDDDER